jgi:hypothetical protein
MYGISKNNSWSRKMTNDLIRERFEKFCEREDVSTAMDLACIHYKTLTAQRLWSCWQAASTRNDAPIFVDAEDIAKRMHGEYWEKMSQDKKLESIKIATDSIILHGYSPAPKQATRNDEPVSLEKCAEAVFESNWRSVGKDTYAAQLDWKFGQENYRQWAKDVLDEAKKQGARFDYE